MTDENVKHKTHKPESKKMLVSYGKMEQLGWFKHDLEEIPKTDDYVIIKTARGLEIGKIVGKFCYKRGDFRWDADKVSEYYEEEKKGDVVDEVGKVVRIATKEDVSEWHHLEISTKAEIERCKKIIEDMKIDMKLVKAEHIFGGERIIFYFTADGRVDFRELVKNLAKEFQTRIEMRQIGARDEAKVLCDHETCGQNCCCARYLKVLKPVNMRMAKLQKATLDPSKISGYCGRLKCCLRYEDDSYKFLKKNMPKKGAWVETEEGTGQVVDAQVLTQLVVVRKQDGTRFAIGVEGVKVIPKPKEQARKDDDKRNNNGSERGRPENKQEKPEERSAQKQEAKPVISKEEESIDEVAELVEQAKSQDSQDKQQEKGTGNNRRRRPNNRRRNRPNKSGQDNNGQGQGQKKDRPEQNQGESSSQVAKAEKNNQDQGGEGNPNKKRRRKRRGNRNRRPNKSGENKQGENKTNNDRPKKDNNQGSSNES